MAHVERRGPNQWRVRWRLPNGKERSKTFTKKRDADAYAAERGSERNRGLALDPVLGRERLTTYIDRWMKGHDYPATRTRQKVEGHLRNHILPAFGDRPISSLQPADIRTWFAELDLAPSTANAVLGTLRQILDTAVEDDVLARNPAARVKRRKEGSDGEMLFLDADEIRLLSQAINERFEALILLAAYSGGRWGELAALRPEDVDVLGKTVTFRFSLSEPIGGAEIKETKSNKPRSVSIPTSIAQIVGEHMGRFPNEVGTIFSAKKGGRLSHTNWYRRDFKPAVERAGLPTALRFHDLRHSHVALCIQHGAHVKAIQERLGHSTVTLTLDRYGHLLPSLDETLREQLEDTFSRSLAAPSRPTGRAVTATNASQRPGEGR